MQSLTGGTLLQRNKFYIVLYRGKDFLPPNVASALAEREQCAKQIQDVEEKVRSKTLEATPSGETEGQAPAGTLAEFYEAQKRWGREVSAEEREKMVEEASKAKHGRLVKRIEHKLAVVSTIRSFLTILCFLLSLKNHHCFKKNSQPLCMGCTVLNAQVLLFSYLALGTGSPWNLVQAL